MHTIVQRQHIFANRYSTTYIRVPLLTFNTIYPTVGLPSKLIFSRPSLRNRRTRLAQLIFIRNTRTRLANEPLETGRPVIARTTQAKIRRTPFAAICRFFYCPSTIIAKIVHSVILFLHNVELFQNVFAWTHCSGEVGGGRFDRYHPW